jgi:hypothetical protein
MSDLATLAQIDEQQAEFVRIFVERGDGDYSAAARAAGFSSSREKTAQKWATQTPAIIAAVHIEVARRLQAGAPLALKVIESIVRDETAPQKIRLDAAKTLLDRAGHIAPRARVQGDGQERTLGEMSLDELKATQERLQAEIQSRAKAVDAQTIDVETAKPVDLLE